MFLATPLLAISALLSQALAAPNGALEEKRDACNHDNLYRSFVDPRYSSSASAFCSSYIRSTVKAAATATTTVTATITGPVQKRDLPATTAYPASRLSSACSCILSSVPSPTTAYTTTKLVTITATAIVTPTKTVTPTTTSTSTTTTTPTTTSTTTTTSISTTSTSITTTTPTTTSTTTTTSTSSTSTSTTATTPTTTSTITTSTTTTTTTPTPTPTGCSNPATIVQNGGFESGSLAPWTILNVYPGAYDAAYYSYGVRAPGYQSTYAFNVDDEAADSYFDVDLGQTISLCAGQKYNFAAEYYMTDAQDGPQTDVEVYIDGTLIAQSNINDAHTPISWKPLTGSFTASNPNPQLKISFIATDYLEVQWGIDNVVITPA
ncbi:hypothetical protein MMC20_004103 [Loxospora ochrophaea]|nr:hypothetical protein [Loxospora ochrophaea]